jgi:uncharacterized membrane protein
MLIYLYIREANMNDEPKRKYNMVFCLGMGLLGAIAMGILYWWFPIIAEFSFSLMASLGRSMSIATSGVLCNGVFWGLIIGVPAFFILRYFIKRALEKKGIKERQEFDEFIQDQKDKKNN